MYINVKIVEPFLFHVHPRLLIDGLDGMPFLLEALDELVGGVHRAEGELRQHDLVLCLLVTEDPI